MSNEFCKNYVATRLHCEINEYKRNWENHRNRYWVIQITLIGATALIPIFNSGQVTLPYETLHIAVTVLGSAAVGLTALTQLLKYQESWPLLKLTWARLEKERELYDRKADDYSSGNDEERWVAASSCPTLLLCKIQPSSITVV